MTMCSLTERLAQSYRIKFYNVKSQIESNHLFIKHERNIKILSREFEIIITCDRSRKLKYQRKNYAC